MNTNVFVQMLGSAAIAQFVYTIVFVYTIAFVLTIAEVQTIAFVFIPYTSAIVNTNAYEVRYSYFVYICHYNCVIIAKVEGNDNRLISFC